ncbi:MAG: CBS domain-containing protein, partial [Giesbergeria sp.]|nr:CBS domain-containing protein [Giesbergeria sp.]
MFFVFGPWGQIYRGGPENLARIAPTRRVERPQALRTRSMDPSDTSPAPVQMPAPPAGAMNARAHDAVVAYAHTLAGPQHTRQPLTRVREVMTTGALTVPPEIRVNDAWRTLAEHHIAQAPVVNALGQVVGLLLRADMAPLDLLPTPGAVQAAIALARRPVSEVMVSPVPTVAA